MSNQSLRTVPGEPAPASLFNQRPVTEYLGSYEELIKPVGGVTIFRQRLKTNLAIFKFLNHLNEMVQAAAQAIQFPYSGRALTLMRLWPNWSWNNGTVTFAKDSPEFSAVWAYTPELE